VEEAENPSRIAKERDPIPGDRQGNPPFTFLGRKPS